MLQFSSELVDVSHMKDVATDLCFGCGLCLVSAAPGEIEAIVVGISLLFFFIVLIMMVLCIYKEDM